jgi:chromosome partitioning protein
MKPEIISFSNQKGGIGKTTTCRESGIYIASMGYKILFVDCDPQGNLSKSLVQDTKVIPGLYEAMYGGGICFKEIAENITMLTGDFRLAGLEKRLIGEIDCYTRLKELFAAKHFDKFKGSTAKR